MIKIIVLALLDKVSDTVQLGTVLNGTTSQCNKKAWGRFSRVIG